MSKKNGKHDINPDAFYKDVKGDYHHDKNKTKFNFIEKRKNNPSPKETVVNRSEQLPVFDSKKYKEKANKKLKEFGSDVRVYNQSSYKMLISVLIGVIIIFGLFFVWSVSNDKFKTEFDCPDCNCPKAEVTCPSISYPDCVCDQTLSCPKVNNSDIIDALNNFSFSVNATCGP